MPKGEEWVSYDDDAPYSSIWEARRRNEVDGIPRHVYADGHIKKWDWELSEDSLADEFRDKWGEPTAFEDHIKRLIEEYGKQGR